jgi:hypothetical protein
MQTDSAAGPSVPAGVEAAAPRPFTWRDIVTSLVILPVVILAIVTAIAYVRMEVPQNAEISLSEYRFILKLARTQPSLRPAIAKAIKDGKIDQKEFDAILDKLEIRPSAPGVPRPRTALKQI